MNSSTDSLLNNNINFIVYINDVINVDIRYNSNLSDIEEVASSLLD